VLKESEISIGTSALNFSVFLGGTVFVTVSQTLFEQQLYERLASIVPNLDPEKLVSSGAASLEELVAPDKLQDALQAYNDSMRVIWYLALGLAAAALVASFGLEWKSVKPRKKDQSAEGQDEEKANSGA
jgi:hypothetical protein